MVVWTYQTIPVRFFSFHPICRVSWLLFLCGYRGAACKTLRLELGLRRDFRVIRESPEVQAEEETSACSRGVQKRLHLFIVILYGLVGCASRAMLTPLATEAVGVETSNVDIPPTPIIG